MKRAVGDKTLNSETTDVLKRQRLTAKSNDFVLVNSAFNGMCKEFLNNNPNKLQPCEVFLEETKFELYNLLCKLVGEGPIKFVLKLHVTYKNSSLEGVEAWENKKFQTSACEMIVANNAVIDEEFQKLMLEKEKYEETISEFPKIVIDSFLVSVVKETSFGHSPLM